MGWQEDREDWIGKLKLDEIGEWNHSKVGCACIGPIHGEPLCPCAMTKWYADRTGTFVMVPIITTLRSKKE